MSFMNLDGRSGSANIVHRLIQERQLRTAKSVGFEDVEMDEAILQAALALFRDRQQQHNPGSRIDGGRSASSSSTIPNGNNRKNGSSDNADHGHDDGRSPGDVKLEKLSINNCPVNRLLDYLIEAAMGMDLFKEFELQGPPEELPEGEGGELGGENSEGRVAEGEEHEHTTSDIFDLDALGFKLRFSRRLRKLELINLPINHANACNLMYGIETNTETGTGCRLDALIMEGVCFVEDENEEGDEHNDGIEEESCRVEELDPGNNNNHNNDHEETGVTPGDGTVVIKELCEGFTKNNSLKTIEITRCGLPDAQIALILDSLAHHPTLTSINLTENNCRNLGLEALDRILVSPDWMHQTSSRKKKNSNCDARNYCQIKSLDLSYQFTSEETYGLEHIQLDILTRNCITSKADIRIYPNLRKLVLQGNQIVDSDMEHLAFLVRHRFPRLEELDLRFNEISVAGLEIFANHSDPNNTATSFMAFNNTESAGEFHDGTAMNTNHATRTIYRDHFPPPSSRLRTIRLTNNPLVMDDHTSIVILKLIEIYPELTQIQSNLEWEDQTPVSNYIQHLFDINRAGRVLLLAGSNGSTIDDIIGDGSSIGESSNTPESGNLIRRQGWNGSSGSISSMGRELPEDEALRRRQLSQQLRRPIPLAAWALVLARLTRSPRYPHYIPEKNSINGMYYLIRHGPIIMEQMVSRANEKSRKKNKSNSKVNIRNGSNNVENRKDPARKRKRGDPALGGYATLAEFLRCELGVTS